MTIAMAEEPISETPSFARLKAETGEHDDGLSAFSEVRPHLFGIASHALRLRTSFKTSGELRGRLAHAQAFPSRVCRTELCLDPSDLGEASRRGVVLADKAILSTAHRNERFLQGCTV